MDLQDSLNKNLFMNHHLHHGTLQSFLIFDYLNYFTQNGSTLPASSIQTATTFSIILTRFYNANWLLMCLHLDYYLLTLYLFRHSSCFYLMLNPYYFQVHPCSFRFLLHHNIQSCLIN